MKNYSKMEKDINIIYKKDGKPYSVRLSRSRIFTPKEWKEFYYSLLEHQKPLFDCLINTGTRINECLHIEKRDIDIENKTITIRFAKRRNIFSDGRIRKIKVSSQYLERLKKHIVNLQEEDKLFNYSKQGAAQLLKNKLKKIGIEDYYNFSLHNIRKTTECWLNFLGNNYLILLKHFGHDSNTSVKHYLTTDVYDSKYKYDAREILGDLYM